MTKPEGYLWETPETMAKRLERILEAIQLAGYGGGGKEAALRTYTSIYEWFDPLYHFEYHARSDEPEAYEYVHNVCVFDKFLPSSIWRPIRLLNVGYRTFIHVACNYKVFWLCQDCKAPLVYDERGEGCPFCGDTFPRKNNRVEVS